MSITNISDIFVHATNEMIVPETKNTKTKKKDIKK